jgi:hypothetical protein
LLTQFVSAPKKRKSKIINANSTATHDREMAIIMIVHGALAKQWLMQRATHPPA